MATIQDPIIPVIARLVRQHPGTLSLGQGVVHYGPPRAALDAVRRFGDLPEEHLYGPVQGQPELLEEIARKLAADNKVMLGSGQSLMVTAGSNMAFLNAILAIADPGDEILLPLPWYFNQEMAIRMIGCIPVGVPTDDRYQLELDALRAAITPRTRAIVTVSPNNPTGAVYPESDLRAVNALCSEHGLYHISDEALSILSGMLPDTFRPHPSKERRRIRLPFIHFQKRMVLRVGASVTWWFRST